MTLTLFYTDRQQKKVSLNTFLDALTSDPPPQCLVWLPLMHRLANVENGKTRGKRAKNAEFSSASQCTHPLSGITRRGPVCFCDAVVITSM